MSDKKIIVIIPTYNEARNMRPLLQKLFVLGIPLDVLIIDENSPDGTAEAVKSMQSDQPRLFLKKRQFRNGLASAYIEGFKHALKHKYDIIIQMDADLSHDPICIPHMIKMLDDYDLVIGSRYTKNGRVSHWSWSRLLLSKGANFCAKKLLNIPINDLTSGFKCIRKEVLEGIAFNRISSKGYVMQIEMTYLAFMNNFHLIEYPITFQGRIQGKSKMSLRIAVEAILKLAALGFRRIVK